MPFILPQIVFLSRLVYPIVLFVFGKFIFFLTVLKAVPGDIRSNKQQCRKGAFNFSRLEQEYIYIMLKQLRFTLEEIFPDS